MYRIEPIPENFLEQKYLPALNAEETHRFIEIKDFQRKKQFLYSRFLLKTELALKLSCLPHEIEFEYSEFGKPTLKKNPNLFFSISHSENYCGYALSDKKIGFDIQIQRPVKNLEQILEKMAHPNEIQMIQNSENALKYFFKLWVLKESYSKALGTGYQTHFKEIDFSVTIAKNLSKFSAYDFDFTIENREDFYLSIAEKDSRPSVVGNS